MCCVHVLYVVKLGNVSDTLFGENIYVLIQLRILRISIMLCQGMNLRTSLASEFLSRCWELSEVFFLINLQPCNMPSTLPPLPFITTVSLMYEIKKIPNNPQPQIKMLDFILRLCTTWTVSLIPLTPTNCSVWRTLARNSRALCNHFTAFDQKIMNGENR